MENFLVRGRKLRRMAPRLITTERDDYDKLNPHGAASCRSRDPAGAKRTRPGDPAACTWRNCLRGGCRLSMRPPQSKGHEFPARIRIPRARQMPARVRIVFPLIALCALAFSPVVVRSPAHDAPQSRADAYPLGLTLRLLERDLTSKEYAEVLATMIPTDLEAEWRRIATADNYEVFLQQHGGKDKVLADPKLKAAYERRLKIAEGFLDLMRSAYKKRGVEPPFDKGEKIDLLAAGTAAGVKNAAAAVSLRAVMPAAGAERQWPRFRGPTGQGTALQADFPMSWSDTENVVWKSEVPGRGNGSPVIWDQKIFVTTASDDGTERLLLCFDRGSGELLWKQAAPKAAKQEKVYWKNSYASSTPATDGQRVIAFFGNSGLVCFDFSGQQLWHQDLGEFTTTHGPGSSP